MTNIELLSQLKEQVTNQKDFINNQVMPLSEAQLTHRIQADKWHVLECVQHLNKYAQFYIPILEKATQTAKPAQVHIVKQGWLGGKFIKMMSPKNTKPQKTLKHMNTMGNEVSTEEVDKFIDWQSRLIKLITQLDGKNLNQQKIPVEFMRLIKLKIGDALQFVIVHQQRHIEQVEKIIELKEERKVITK